MVIQPEQMLFPFHLREENDYDDVRDCLEHVKMENSAYQRTSGDVEMEENPVYENNSQITSAGVALNELTIGDSDYI